MPYLPAARTRRRLLKVASLGLAGLLAGLLAGCNQHNTVTATSSTGHTAGSLFSTSTDDLSPLSLSLDARQIPSLRHPPSTRRLEYGSVRLSHESPSPSHSRS